MPHRPHVCLCSDNWPHSSPRTPVLSIFIQRLSFFLSFWLCNSYPHKRLISWNILNPGKFIFTSVHTTLCKLLYPQSHLFPLTLNAIMLHLKFALHSGLTHLNTVIAWSVIQICNPWVPLTPFLYVLWSQSNIATAQQQQQQKLYWICSATISYCCALIAQYIIIEWKVKIHTSLQLHMSSVRRHCRQPHRLKQRCICSVSDICESKDWKI